MVIAEFTASDAAWVALAAFLVLVGVGLFYFFFRAGETLGQVTRTIEHTEGEVLPVINKAGGTLDRVNRELDKVGVVTDSAVDATKAADTAVRTVSGAVTRPIQKLAGFMAGGRAGASSFASSRDFAQAKQAARDAAATREQELADDATPPSGA